MSYSLKILISYSKIATVEEICKEPHNFSLILVNTYFIPGLQIVAMELTSNFVQQKLSFDLFLSFLNYFSKFEIKFLSSKASTEKFNSNNNNNLNNILDGDEPSFIHHFYSFYLTALISLISCNTVHYASLKQKNSNLISSHEVITNTSLLLNSILNILHSQYPSRLITSRLINDWIKVF
jgi:hypothetical protein